MKLSEDSPQQGYVITAYDAQSIMVNGRAVTTSLVIAPDQLLLDWSLLQVADMTAEHITPIVDLNPELVLLGTGDSLVFPEVSAYAALIKMGIGVEAMDTGAACRTYNVLMGEGRRVVAGLILPG